MKKVVEWVHRHPVVRRALVLLGFGGAYRLLRERFLVLRHGTSKEVTIRGIRLRLPLIDDSTRGLYLHPYWYGDLYEAHVVNHLVERLTDARCFVDVGANMGFYTTLAGAIHGPRGVVHAVEMDADNIERIREAVRINGLENVTLHHLALGDRQGEVEYYLCGSLSNTLEVGSELRGQYSKQSVPMTTLDALVAQCGIEPDVIKIDVEGAEYLVLQGMTRLLARPKIQIYCEVHLHSGRGSLSSFGHSAAEVFDCFKQFGFTVTQLRLRSDSRADESVVSSPDQITESVMLYAEK